MKNIQAVIFDMDGVIFDSESLWKIMFEKANEKYGLSLDEKYRQSICGKNEENIRNELKEMALEVNVDEYRDFIVDGVNSMIMNGDFETKTGFVQLISYLKERGLKLALATSSPRDRAQHMFKIKKYEISDLFDVCVYGDEVGVRSKPDPYIFEIAADKLETEKNKCVVVEDSLNGITAAVIGGFVPVMAVDLIPPDDYCKENCQYIIDNLSQFIRIMEGI